MRMAEEAQARDAAVGKDVEPHVRDALDRGHFVLERVERIGSQRRARDELAPLDVGRLKASRSSLARRSADGAKAARVEAAGAGRVAFEVFGVDFDASNRSRSRKTYDRPFV